MRVGIRVMVIKVQTALSFFASKLAPTLDLCHTKESLWERACSRRRQPRHRIIQPSGPQLFPNPSRAGTMRATL
ncbi:hypothetical protein FHG55_21475 [Pseudomonas jessenii]|uniref:Uncharacterized protein n=1 Tax=Pseudomonas jessenii TaxID=77298 RepID=A0A5C4KTJ9_PSEJE|nr:hypothetical protein FHG55_21475 [Pseudomonas jessenii]